MHLLIIGNGFDLAHGLPTRYTDFLKYCRDYSGSNPISKCETTNNEFLSFINENVWLKYFLNSSTNINELSTWIDFEKEIAVVVDFFDEKELEIKHVNYMDGSSDIVIEFPNIHLSKFLPIISSCCKQNERKEFIVTNRTITDVKALINFLYFHLKIFARAFEVYCLCINETIICKDIISTKLKNPIDSAKKEIDTIDKMKHLSSYEINKRRDGARKFLASLNSKITPIDYFGLSKFGCVLSFNYTNTYERLYGTKETQYCYVHGKAQEDSSKTNIIIGIDDTLRGGEESKNFKWIRFKKYYQRIILKTGSEYKNWFNSQDKHGEQNDYVHIVGHSLDKTDHDVLYELFCNKKFRIIIYYYCQDDFEDKVQKTIRLLAYKGRNGRDELINRVHGDKWSIKFLDQYDKLDGLFINNENNADNL